MLVLNLLVFFLLNFLIILKLKTYKNIIVPFTFFWSLSILMSEYLASNFYPVSSFVYNRIYVFVSVTLISFFIFAKRYKNNNIEVSYETVESKRFEKLIITVKILLLLILLYYLYKYNLAKAYLPQYKMRIIRFEIGPVFSSGRELLFYNYVIASLVELFGLLSLVKLFIGDRLKFSYVISIISLIIYSLVGNGRFGLFNALIFVFATIFLNRKNKKDTNGIKPDKSEGSSFFFLSLIIFVFLITMVQIGSARSSLETSLFEKILNSIEQSVAYFTGPFRTLNYFYNTYESSYISFSYGRAFFSGLDEFLLNFLSKINGNVTSINNTISDITNPVVKIGIDSNFNAFYTILMNLFLDFGKYGSVIGGIILGYLSAVVWNYNEKRKNIYSFSMIVYFTLILISSEYRFELQQFKSFFVLGSLLLLSQIEYKNGRKLDRNV